MAEDCVHTHHNLCICIKKTNSELFFALIEKNHSKSAPPNVDHHCLPTSETVNTLADI